MDGPRLFDRVKYQGRIWVVRDHPGRFAGVTLVDEHDERREVTVLESAWHVLQLLP
jgi:hypothetical protein